jgi:beta-galactosidase GanA
MKRSLIMVSVLSLFAVGCSSTKTVTQLPPETTVAQATKLDKKEAEFLKSNGTVTVEFDSAGNFYGLVSTGTAYIDTNHSSSRENAYNIALMRAKRNVAEFLTNDVSSNKFSRTITKTLMKNDANESLKSNKKEGSDNASDIDKLDDGGGDSETMTVEDRVRGQRVSTFVKEQMTDNTAALLRGLVITNRNIEKESNLVSVEVRVSKHSVAASHQLKALIDGTRQ